MEILFSIVSHNQEELVRRLIRSLDRNLKVGEHNLRIIITENLNQTMQLSSSRFSIDFVQNLRPKGFGSNHNSAFEKIYSDYIFIINPDIIFIEEFDLTQVINHLEVEEIDLSSPRIIDPNGSSEDYKRADLTLLNLIKRKILKLTNEKFDWFAGMFLVINSESFNTLKGFDTDFFMYVEDCDLNMRARKIGMKIADIEDYCVIHDAQRASRRSLQHFKWHLTSLLKYWFFK